MGDVMDSTMGPFSRFLAGGPDVKVDYSILAVMVTTLGLILIVEITRHFIDHKAEHRPFFKSVLTSVYSELSTLGIVEAAIYVLHSYYAGLDVPKEKVFAYCHFLLFFTAIFNALQSAVQAIFAVRVSKKLWNQTEELELHHYVAIREEFDFLERQVERLKPDSANVNSTWDKVCHKALRLYREISNAHTFQKYRRLLVQVRFHELRLHFLQANDLPLKLRVSEYLQRSEIALLQRLTCISAFAWILLTGATNFTYFIFGMAISASKAGNRPTSIALAYMYIGGNILFALISVVLYFKMGRIFNNIMKMKFIDCGVTTVRMDHDQYSDMRKKQLALFWGEHPSYVIGIIQVMQFGYAMSAGILIIFWQKLEKDAFVPPFNLFITLVVCYSVYVLIIAQVIPKYTMCTSLGALVDRKRLKEMTTKYKLEEAVLSSLASNSADDTRGYTISESDESSVVSNLSNIAELVQTKTDELRSTRNLLAETQSLGGNSQRRSRRHKAFSDSRSIAMMRMYGSSNTIQEGVVASPIEDAKMTTSGSYPDFSVVSADQSVASASRITFQIEGNPDILPPAEVSVSSMGQQCTSGESSNEKILNDVSKNPPDVSTKSFKEALKGFMMSRKFRLLGELFGTMVAFFLVGMRVEVLILANKDIKDLGTSFHLSVEDAFYCLLSWLCLLVMSSAILLSLTSEHNGKHRIACIIDLVLGSVSLVVLLVAESQRCCGDSSEYDCCGPFGSRTHGGIGDIEPFTSLIGLRVFRYFMAKLILRFRGRSKEQDDDDDDETDDAQTTKEHGKHEDMVEMKGTIIDLWQHAVSLYPHVVAKEGEFSSALFKAMLGINVEGVGRRGGGSGQTNGLTDNPVSGKPDDTGAHALDALYRDAIADLVAPDSVLVLPMRRCDWMLPPYVDHWRVVDVVMTEKEIVILEAIDLMEITIKSLETKHVNAVLRTIVKTDGGYGMRLRDVVVGRKILGHVDMTSIDSLNVERFPAFFSQDEDDFVPHRDDLLRDEYWSADDLPAVVRSRNARWKAVCEDQLKIHSVDSSTYLRFYNDLRLKESEKDVAPSRVLAFQWCKTIGRVRGSHNLAQKLPHFFQNNELELLDYVHVTHRGSGEENHGRVNKIENWVKKVKAHAKPTLQFRSTSFGEGGGEPVVQVRRSLSTGAEADSGKESDEQV